MKVDVGAMNQRTIVLLFLFWTGIAAGAPLSNAQVAPPAKPLVGWVPTLLPTAKDRGKCANSADGWQVSPGQGNSSIVSAPRRDSQPISLTVKDGRLVASNLGECGGAIEWEPLLGPKTTVIKDVNPVAFISTEQGVFDAEGIAHLSLNEGRLLKLSQSDGAWTATEVLDLGMAPKAVVVIGEKVTVIGARGDLSVDLNKMSITTLCRR